MTSSLFCFVFLESNDDSSCGERTRWKRFLVFIVVLNVCLDLRKAHEQQKVLLEEDFGKLRLSLQVSCYRY